MTLGERVKYLRNSKNMERQELADALGITYHALAKYETNDREPDYNILLKIADYFDVSTDYLLCRTNDPSPHPRLETNTAHHTDDPMSELPPEARKSVEEFIDFVYKKYGKKDEQ